MRKRALMVEELQPIGEAIHWQNHDYWNSTIVCSNKKHLLRMKRYWQYQKYEERSTLTSLGRGLLQTAYIT